MRTIILIALACFTLNTQAAKPGSDSGSEPTGYVGPSTQMHTGSAGFAAFYQACQADYGDSAIMCDTKQVLQSPNVGLIPLGAEGAWVRPFWVHIVGDSSRDYSVDYGGYRHNSVSATADCGYWMSESNQGMTLRQNYSPLPNFCNVARPVACCR